MDESARKQPDKSILQAGITQDSIIKFTIRWFLMGMGIIACKMYAVDGEELGTHGALSFLMCEYLQN